MMLVGYARISTQDQKPELQTDALTAAGCEKIFMETASGAQRDRPQLTAALEYLREGDTLVVWKLDRLARSMIQLVKTMDELRGRGIRFRSLTEAIDTGTATGELTWQLVGAMAQFERSLTQERTRAGLAAAKARGKSGGRPRVMSDDDIAMARALMADPDIPAKVIAQRLGVSRATLYSAFPGGRAAVMAER